MDEWSTSEVRAAAVATLAVAELPMAAVTMLH